MCIDVKFVKCLLRHMSDKLENAKLLSDEEKSALDVQFQLEEAVKTYLLLRHHMQGVFTMEGEIDLDALVHSIL